MTAHRAPRGPLEIALLGGVDVRFHHDEMPLQIPPLGQSVLGYLLLAGRRKISRQRLAGTFWPDSSEADARACLSTVLWRLQQRLNGGRADQEPYLLAGRHDVAFNWDAAYRLDIEVFEAGVQRALFAPAGGDAGGQVEALQRVLALYRGDLVEDDDRDCFTIERERFRLRYRAGLSKLLEFQRAVGDQLAILDSCSRILRFDPASEEAHRTMIGAHLRLSDRASAVRQYWRCRHILADELGVSPMPETTALVAEFLTAGGGEVGARAIRARAPLVQGSAL